MRNWNIQWPVLLSTVRLESNNTQGVAGSLVCGPRKENQLHFHKVSTAVTMTDSNFCSNPDKIEI